MQYKSEDTHLSPLPLLLLQEISAMSTAPIVVYATTRLANAHALMATMVKPVVYALLLPMDDDDHEEGELW